jgi:hypothetical protein
MRSYIEEAGLSNKYLTVDTTALQKDFTAGSLPSSLMRKLKEYENIVVQDRLRVKKK